MGTLHYKLDFLPKQKVTWLKVEELPTWNFVRYFQSNKNLH